MSIYVVYINLDKDINRKKDIESELSKVFDKKEINRFSAVYDKVGAIGCTKSHIKCIENFIESKCDYGFIFEDDFEWELSEDDTKNIINKYLQKDINVCMLSYHIPMVKLDMNSINDNLCYVSNAQTTVGYMLNKSFAKEMLETFQVSLKNLEKTFDFNLYSIDQYWKKLQTIENKVYASIPRLGKQKSQFSNIENKVVDYQGSCFVMILGYKEYKNMPFNYKCFVGKNVEINNNNKNVVILECEDDNKMTKFILAYKWIITNHPNIDFIFKTESKYDIDFNKLFNVFQTISVYSQHIFYAGNVEYEYESNKMNKRAIYCSNYGYFLSKYVNHIICNVDHTIYDKYTNYDNEVGYIMNNNKIIPSKIDIKTFIKDKS
jgi:GR25 family glycosyltransferase involved in LPS biosynthesis